MGNLTRSSELLAGGMASAITKSTDGVSADGTPCRKDACTQSNYEHDCEGRAETTGIPRRYAIQQNTYLPGRDQCADNTQSDSNQRHPQPLRNNQSKQVRCGRAQ